MKMGKVGIRNENACKLDSRFRPRGNGENDTSRRNSELYARIILPLNPEEPNFLSLIPNSNMVRGTSHSQPVVEFRKEYAGSLVCEAVSEVLQGTQFDVFIGCAS